MEPDALERLPPRPTMDSAVLVSLTMQGHNTDLYKQLHFSFKMMILDLFNVLTSVVLWSGVQAMRL